MKNFKQHHNVILEFFDAIDGAVKHIDHLEENILNKGKQGVIEAINQIESSISYFVDESDYKISTKFDGAPAIVAGVDTKGKFFVASKSAFAKNPKINYTEEDITENHGTGGLADKLKLALRYLPSLNIKGIYQMDYMFDPQMKIVETPETIDGVKNENKFLTFTPNTIKYAVTEDSPYGKEISTSKIGVAIHIEYIVRNGILKVKKYTSDPEEFSKSNTVFVFNVLANKPKNDKSSFSKLLLRDVKAKKTKLLRLADKVDFSLLDDFTGTLKSYINSEIRSGRFLEDTSISTEEYINYITNRFTKDLERLKSEKGKAKKTEQMKATLKSLQKLKPSIKNAFEITKIVANLKNNLIKIFNEITKNDLLGTYLEESPNNWQTTAPEGFALSKVTADGAEITKMVDREEFSRANFGTGKPTSPESQESYISNPPIFNRGEGTRLQTHPTGKKKIGSFNEMYRMLMLKEFEDAEDLKKTLVIYPGRFHPFHKGHASVYDKLKKQFPTAEVFISTSGKTNDDNSPFEFEEKKMMIQSAGIDPNFVEMTKNPYLAEEITKKYDLDNTKVIFAVSEKDMEGDRPRFKFGLKKDGTPSYFQPYDNNKKLENASKHGYIATLPTMDFNILGKDIRSASQIRELYKNSDEQGRRDLIIDLYGSMDEEVKRIFDNKLI
jgi:cytidyltransferase-like protein